jgi:hypothetical protein
VDGVWVQLVGHTRVLASGFIRSLAFWVPLAIIVTIILLAVWAGRKLTSGQLARVGLLILLAVLTFSVIQPLIWELLFPEETLPGLSRDFGTLTTILLTILGLLVASLGVVVYELLRDRLERELLTQMREEATQLGQHMTALLHLTIGNQHWERYEEEWGDAGYHADARRSRRFNQRVQAAVRHSRAALKRAKGLPDKEEFRVVKWQSRNALAFHLASVGTPVSRDEALNLANEMKGADSEDFHALETRAWVYLTFSEPGEENWEKGRQMLQHVLESNAPTQDWKDAVSERYQGVFGRKLGDVLPRATAKPSREGKMDHG